MASDFCHESRDAATSIILTRLHSATLLHPASQRQTRAAAMDPQTISMSATMDSSEFSAIPRPIDADTNLSQKKQKQPSSGPAVEQESHPYSSDASEDGLAAAKNDEQWVTGGQLVALLCLLTTSMFLVMLDNSIIATAVSAAAVGSRPNRH
jgi:hypothetical protein